MKHHLARTFLVAALICFVSPIESTFASPITSQLHPAIAVNASVRITNGVFGRTNIVVQSGGTLTIINRDTMDYNLKIGATKVTVKAKNTRTVPLPQRGVFSITCAKFPALRATLTVR